MNTSILRFLLLLFLAIPGYAQEMVMSDDIPLRGDVSYELLGAFKGRILLFRDQVTKYEVQGFDQQLRTSWSKVLTLDKKNPKVLGVTYSKNDFSLIYHFRDQTNSVLKAMKFDPGANMIDSVTIKNFGYLFFTPELEMVLSEDRSKVLIYYVEKQTTLHAFLFDNTTFSLLWEKSITPAAGYSMWEDFRQILTDNEGNLYLILETNRFLVRREGHNYQIFAFFGEDNRLVQFIVPLEGKLTYDVRFCFDNLNYHLVAAGLYAEKVNDRASGYFMLRINPNADGHFINFEPFDDLFVSSLAGKEIEKNRGISEITIRELVLRRDGGVLMIAERTREFERRLGAPNRVSFDGMGRFIVDYYLDDIVAISMHPDGKTHWKTILPKKQYSQDDGGVYSSFFLFKTPGALRFLFNDEIRSENTVSAYLLNGSGSFDRQSLMNTEKLDIRLRFRDALQVSAGEVIIPSERRNRIRLVKLTF